MTLSDARRWARQLQEERGYFVLVGRSTPNGEVVIACSKADGSSVVLTTAAEVNDVLLRGF